MRATVRPAHVPHLEAVAREENMILARSAKTIRYNDAYKPAALRQRESQAAAAPAGK